MFIRLLILALGFVAMSGDPLAAKKFKSSEMEEIACQEVTQHGPILLKTRRGEITGPLCFQDSDSFAVGPAFVRLKGIDAPEPPRNCLKLSKIGQSKCEFVLRSMDFLLDVLLPGATCNSEATESRNRWIAECKTNDGKDIAAELVRSGRACAATKYDHETNIQRTPILNSKLRQKPLSEECGRQLPVLNPQECAWKAVDSSLQSTKIEDLLKHLE